MSGFRSVATINGGITSVSLSTKVTAPVDELVPLDEADRTIPHTPNPADEASLPGSPDSAQPSNACDVSLAAFVRSVDELGLMSESEIRRLLDAMPAADRPGDSRALARVLAAAGKLTGYQAGALCQGKARGLAIGRYVVLERLGAGGMGMVFKAQHRRLKRVVALKILPPSLTRNPDTVQRFLRESEVAARLDHPNLVRALDADESAGLHFLVMEFIDGRDLYRFMQKRGALPVALALDFVVQAARGLAAAHAAGITHRDIKPSNLILDKAGVVKVLDLGLAHLEDPADGGGDPLTVVGAVMGTVDYMSPEQAYDARLVDARSDVYSLGCTFYSLLTARPLYSRQTVMQRLLAHREAPIPSVRTVRPDVSEAIDDVVQRMVAKQPDDRPQSMAELITMLEACRTSEPALPSAWPRTLKVYDDRKKGDGGRSSWLRKTPRRAPSHPAPAGESVLPRRQFVQEFAAATGLENTGSGYRSEDRAGRVLTIHCADTAGFQGWLDFVRAKGFIPSALSAFSSASDRPEFAAVARPNRDGVPWEVMIHPDAVELGKHVQLMASRGSSLALLSGYANRVRTGVVSLFRPSSGPTDSAFGLDRESLQSWLSSSEPRRRRIASLVGYPVEGGRRFAVVTAAPRSEKRAQRFDLDLSLGALEQYLDAGRDDGFAPIALSAYVLGGALRFSALLQEHAVDRTLEFRFAVTANALHDELLVRGRHGFSPALLCGFLQEFDSRYVAVWTKKGSER